MPPRGVTAETASADWTRRTCSSWSRENSAMAPKVPRLHCVSGLDISRCKQIDGCGAHRSHRNGSGSGMNGHSPGQDAGRIPSRQVRTSRSGMTPNRLLGSERRAGLHHEGPAGQRIGREAAGRERAGDGVVVVLRIEQIVHAERPEEAVVCAAQLQIDGGIAGMRRWVFAWSLSMMRSLQARTVASNTR